MVMVAVLPNRRFDSGAGELPGGVAFESMHDPGQCALAKLPDEMQVVGHYNRSVNDESVSCV